MTPFDEIATRILDMRQEVPTKQSLLVGISGIDASGKGYVTAKLATVLSQKANVAAVNVDGWLNLPSMRFSEDDPGRHFYECALRLDEMFDRLVLPLKKNRSVDVIADVAEETASEFRPHRYIFDDIDIILLEGIFLFKRRYIHHFDLKIWIECSFDKELERSIARSQEGLSPRETVRAYRTIYFPAQRLHLEKDAPVATADMIYDNN